MSIFQLIQIDEWKIVSMDEISEDGYWQSIDGEWVPTEKQLEAINNGAIPHDNVIVNQGEREPIPDTFTHQVEDISSESKTLELNKCAACGNHFEGSEARKCPTKKCNNPICLNCDPLETTMSKTKDAVVLVVKLARLNIAGIISDDLAKRVKCSDCLRNSHKQDRAIISAMCSLLATLFSVNAIGSLIPINVFLLFLGLFGCIYLIFHKILRELYYPVQPKFSRLTRGSIITIIVIVILAAWVVIPNQQSNNLDKAMIDQWHNSVQTLELDKDGNVNDSQSLVVEWRDEGLKLILTFEDDSDYEYYFRYQISTPFLFIAPYEDSNLTSINADECIVYSNMQSATDESYWENVDINTPAWCNFD